MQKLTLCVILLGASHGIRKETPSQATGRRDRGRCLSLSRAPPPSPHGPFRSLRHGRSQVIGGPAWIETEKYDITARPDGEGQPSADQWKAMVAKLLAERFKLTFHRDKKELSVYLLIVLTTGPKLMTSDGDPHATGGINLGGLGKLSARNASFALTWVPDEFQFTELRNLGGPPMPLNTQGHPSEN